VVGQVPLLVLVLVDLVYQVQFLGRL
jgi:hypothetical protein